MTPIEFHLRCHNLQLMLGYAEAIGAARASFEYPHMDTYPYFPLLTSWSPVSRERHQTLFRLENTLLEGNGVVLQGVLHMFASEGRYTMSRVILDGMPTIVDWHPPESPTTRFDDQYVTDTMRFGFSPVFNQQDTGQ